VAFERETSPTPSWVTDCVAKPGQKTDSPEITAAAAERTARTAYFSQTRLRTARVQALREGWGDATRLRLEKRHVGLLQKAPAFIVLQMVMNHSGLCTH